MKLKYLVSIAMLGITLIGCNTTGIDADNPAAMPSSKEYSEITVYSSHADIRQKYHVLGKVTAQNKFPNGKKATPQELIIELKRQAAALGANGIVHITPGTVQTTADALMIH